ncbi:unnamed protein product [Phaeothamnion confervicola]
MSRVTPVRREDVPELEDVFKRAERALGFVPNSFFVMARKPGILRAFSMLSREVIGIPGKVPLPLKRLAALMASYTTGCMYCTAHTAESAASVDGVPPEKVEAIMQYETSPLFSAAERAALRVAQLAATTPNGVTDEDMEELKKHFDEDQVVELVASVCLFGWLNRWNDTMATGLEERPLAFGEARLASSGWRPGKHVRK